MNDKAADFVYAGAIYPITLHDVEMREINGEWHPKIDVKKQAAIAIQSLAEQAEPLSGNQIAFIRAYFHIPQTELAELVQAPLASVKQWENTDNLPAGMQPEQETLLKDYLQKQLLDKESSHQLKTTGLFSAGDKPKKSPPDPDVTISAPKKPRKK